MNARTGKLSNRDLAQIERTQEILNEWIDMQESRGVTSDDDLSVNIACSVSGLIADFIYEYGE